MHRINLDLAIFISNFAAKFEKYNYPVDRATRSAEM